MKRNQSCWLFVALGVILTSTLAIAEYAKGTDQEDLDGPIISPLLSEIILQNGQNFTIKCKGKRELQIKRQDIAEETYGTFKMVEKKLNSTDLDYPFEVALDLYNVDQYTVGYYACFDDTVNSSTILNNLMEEPSNTDHVTYTYIYVNEEGGSNWEPPVLEIYKENKYFLRGENFTLNCSVQYQLNSAIALSWVGPKNGGKGTNVTSTNELHVTPGQNLFNAITILNATEDDKGTYTCILSGGHQKTASKETEKIFLSQPTIILKKSIEGIIKTAAKNVQLMVEIATAYPPPTFHFYRDNISFTTNTTKYESHSFSQTGDLVLKIFNCSVRDTANYTIEATSGNTTAAVTFDLRILAKPIVDIGSNYEKICYQNSEINLSCEALGYPLPTIEWIFTDNKGSNATLEGIEEKKSEYKVVSSLNKAATNSGNVTCKASNKKGSDSASLRLLIYEISEGFGVLDKETWYPENHKVSIRCIASKYKFSNATWLGLDGEELEQYVKYSESSFSHVAKLKIDQVALSQAGTYTCMARYFNGSYEYENATVIVEAMREPIIYEPKVDREWEVQTFQPVEFSCVADGIPVPTIEWFKDDAEVINETNGLILRYHRNHTVVNSTISLSAMHDVNQGKYECLVTSEGMFRRKFINLVIVSDSTTTLLSVIGAVILMLIVLVLYLTWKIRKEKKFRKELAAAGLLYFKEGVTKSLNPDLGIDEQAELLPYNEKFEFSPDKLILGKQLGAGAFGVVYKADARGIINAEETTPVAVKMVKKTADNMYIKALASELKIMVHLGKHINIVNLLGACTKNVGKRELIVIVEYCKFGNIHNYMQKHREVFIDQLTDNKEKNLGKVNRGYSCSSASSGMNSDYFGTNHTQATDHTFVNTANTSRSGRKVSETGYVQPEWRSNYESDYSFDGRNPRPLTSRDLLAWAFQIARGMEYLASRKVLHGDLAARNVLLAEDNIVKICDFGLARSIYKNDEYQKKENSLLPVKWLAIECMMDRIFSTQSDVWSFGIVLWEMFSLARTPYPNMSPQQLLQWLSDGHRLEKPSYADDRLYGIMKRCWDQKPNARPTFPQLQELLGSFLEDNVRNYYVDLNSTFSDLNVKSDGQEDYLAMVSAPDYNNLVTPSPHHYVNEVRSFFPPTPTQVPLDEEGYLQMTPMNPSIFSPRSQSTKFDFDAKKLDPRLNEGRGGSELTPMLTLNNLPARGGSDSDHEGHSPYLNMCPRIVEEIDDVFKPNHNNLKNIQNGAVTNPTYITLDVDVEKKPKDINNYINVPNGLVK